MKFASLVWWTTTAVLLGLGSSVANGPEETTTTVEATLESASPDLSAHGIGSSVTNGLEASVKAEATLESASPRFSAHGHVRKNSNVNGGHHEHGRNLLFLKKKSVTIDSPLNGAVIAASNDGSKMDVVVSFKSGGLFNKLKTIDLLMDSKVVATKQSASANGKESFSVDLKGVASGLHQLQARGSAGARLFPNLRRGRSVQSKVVSVTITTTSPVAPNAPTVPTVAAPNVPTVAAPKVPSATDPSSPMAPKVSPVKPPVKAPTRPIVVSPINATACGLNQSFLYFLGHNEAISSDKGVVNVTWIPAFVFGIKDINFLWCGNLSYDVFVVQGETNFTGLNATVPQLIERSKRPSSGMKHIETTALSLGVRDLAPGLVYSILVTAKTASGHFSFNRGQAVVKVSSTSPVIKSSFTRMVLIPESNGTFQVKKVGGQNAVVFSGNLPEEALSIKPLDFVYFFDSDGNATMGQFLTKTNGTAGQVTWAFRPTNLTDVFDELDVSADLANQDLPALKFNGDKIDSENALSDAEFNALDINVKVNLCIAYGIDAATCLEELNGRRLFIGGWIEAIGDGIKAVGGAIKKGAEVFVEAVVDVVTSVVDRTKEGLSDAVDAIVEFFRKAADVIADVVYRGVSGGLDLRLLDISSSYKLTSGNALEVGAKFDVSARCRVDITVSVIRLLHSASIRLFGGFGIEGYLLMNERIQSTIRPDALKIFQKSYYKVFYVGFVPVIITNRPSVFAFAELSLEADGQALLALAAGYEYDFVFSYDIQRSPVFQKTTNIVPRPRSPRDPVFNVRLNALAELGITFAWDVLLYEVLQASAAIDLGSRAELEVGATVESIAITTPYFYTLNQFDISAFVRARLFLGFNTNLGKLLRSALEPIANVPIKYFKAPYSFPNPDWLQSGAKLAAPLQKALEKARVDPILQTAKDITAGQFSALEPDPYKNFRGSIKGMDANFGLSVTFFNQDFKIASLPTISVVAAPPQYCTGSDAVTVKVSATASNRNAVEDSAMWFADFDGSILSENSKGWIISSDRSNFNSVTLSLPRSAINRPGFSMYEGPDLLGEVYLRATPKLMPFPKNSLIAADEITASFEAVPRFECCDAADCAFLSKKDLLGKSACGANRMCNLGERFFPSPREFRGIPPPIVLTINLSGLGSNLGIEYFDVYRINELGQTVGSVLTSLGDNGSGKGDDKVAGDAIFSNAGIPIPPLNFIQDETILLRAFPIIASVFDVKSRYNFYSSVQYDYIGPRT